ncbi:MAG: CBS domain-containing protein [Mariniblastus sp.]|jgi:CBS domain-containing protein
MILKDLMRELIDVCSLPLTARLSDAAKMMHDDRVGSVVIVDDANSVIGIITDRDIAMTLALGAGTPNSTVEEAMSRDVKTIPDTMSTFDVSRFFRTANVKRLPVVNSGGSLVGIVSLDDVVSLLAREMFDVCSSLEPKLGHIV